MDSINFAQFDIRGTNPDNRKLGEKITIEDKTCPWVIPNGSPFFGEPAITKVYDARGAELRHGPDYKFVEEFIPFCELSGRSITCFIELSYNVRKNNAFITVDYQSIGAFFFPRNNLKDWIKDMGEGTLPIPWHKVLKVPAQLPSEFHSHSIITEIGDWFELSFFFHYMAGIYKTRDPQVFFKVDQAIDEAFAKLKAIKDEQLQRLVEHDADYEKPHNPTKGDLQLGLLDNFATASVQDDLAGIAKDLFSTPGGANELAKLYERPDSGSMPQGIIPISRYGDNLDYIPDTLSGSFEGLGSESAAAGYCLEQDGALAVLNNRYDGRMRGLYVTKVKNYNQPTGMSRSNLLRYEPPAVVKDNIVLDRVVAGSGGKVLLVGKHATNNWYLCLPGGTLDPKAHALVKCDMTAVANFITDASRPGYSQNHSGVIHHMGDWLVLVQSYTVGGAASNVARQAFFRIPTADVAAGKNVAWSQFNISYTDYAGTALSNQSYMELYKVTGNTSAWTQLGPFKGTPFFTGYRSVGRTPSISAEKQATPGIFYFNILNWYYINKVTPPGRVVTNCVFEMAFEFNPATGVFTSKAKPTVFTFDFTQANRSPDQASRYAHFGQSGTPASMVLLPTGEFVVTNKNTGSSDGDVPDPGIVVKLNGRGTPEAALGGTLLQSITVNVEYNRLVSLQPPTPLISGAFPAGVVAHENGELYGAVNPATGKREIFFREVSGDYQIRPESKNLDLGNVYARPLADKVYLTNLNHHDPMIQLTGTAAALSGMGVEAGALSLSCCAWSTPDGWGHALPTNPALRAPATAGVLVSFPRTFSVTKSVNPDKLTFKGETFFGLSQAAFDQIAGFKTGGTAKGYCFTLNVLHAGTPGYAGLNHAVLQMAWEHETDGIAMQRVLLLRPILEAPNSSHPNIHLITGFTELHSPIAVKGYSESVPLSDDWGTGWQFTSYEDFPRAPVRESLSHMKIRPLLSMYRNGDVLSTVVIGGHTLNNGYWCPIQNVFDLNISTNRIGVIASGGADAGEDGGGVERIVVIPKVGVTDYTLTVIEHPEVTYPPYRPPVNIPESWTCKVTGATTTQKHHIGGPYWPDVPIWAEIIGYGGGGERYAICTRCNTQGSNSDLPAFVASHYVHTPSQYDPGYTPPGPNIPWAPDDVFINAGLPNPYARTGGVASIFRKTVGSTVSWYQLATGLPGNRWVLSFKPAELLLCGTLYTLPAGTMDLRDLMANPRNRTLYIYATVENIEAKYIVSTTKLRRNNAVLLVGVLTTNDTQLLKLECMTPTMIGRFMLSHERDNGIIPVSAGIPQDAGVFTFVKNAELLA